MEIAAYPEQLRFLSSKASNVVFQGGARSGKTWAGVLKCLLLALEWPECWGMYVAPSYKQLQQAATPHFTDLGLKLGLAGRWRWNQTEGRITLPTGGTILLRSAENADALLGATLGWCIGDEVALWRKQAYDYLMGRLSDPKGPRQAFFTFTPKGRGHWAFDTLGLARDGNEIIHTTTSQNPTLPKDYLDRLDREYGVGTNLHRQEVLGEYVAWEGLVYAHFDPEQHVAPAPPAAKLVRTMAGVDWGWTNPGVILVGALDEEGRVWLVDETCESEHGIDWWVAEARRLHDKWGVTQFWCDPSSPENIAAFRTGGIWAERANNEVVSGIAEMGARLADGRLMLTPQVPHLQTELGVYCWKQRSDGTLRNDEPEKVMDHACDAARYLCMAYRAPMPFIQVA